MAKILALSQRECSPGICNEAVHLAVGFSALGARKLGPKFPGLGRQMMRVWGSAKCSSCHACSLVPLWKNFKSDNCSTAKQNIFLYSERTVGGENYFMPSHNIKQWFLHQLRNLPRDVGSPSAHPLSGGSWSMWSAPSFHTQCVQLQGWCGHGWAPVSWQSPPGVRWTRRRAPGTRWLLPVCFSEEWEWRAYGRWDSVDAPEVESGITCWGQPSLWTGGKVQMKGHGIERESGISATWQRCGSRAHPSSSLIAVHLLPLPSYEHSTMGHGSKSPRSCSYCR